MLGLVVAVDIDVVVNVVVVVVAVVAVDVLVVVVVAAADKNHWNSNQVAFSCFFLFFYFLPGHFFSQQRCCYCSTEIK